MQSSQSTNLYAEITKYKDKEAEYERKLQYLQKIIQRDKKQLEERNHKIVSLQQARDNNKHASKWKEAYYKVSSERDRLRTIVDNLRIENAQYEGQVQTLTTLVEKTLTQGRFSSVPREHSHPEILLDTGEGDNSSKSVTWAEELEVPEQPRTMKIPTPTSSSQRCSPHPAVQDESSLRSDGTSKTFLDVIPSHSHQQKFPSPPRNSSGRLSPSSDSMDTSHRSEDSDDEYKPDIDSCEVQSTHSESPTREGSPMEKSMEDEISEHMNRTSLEGASSDLRHPPSPPPYAVDIQDRIIVYEDEDAMDTSPSPEKQTTKKQRLKPPSLFTKTPLAPISSNVNRRSSLHKNLSDSSDLKVPSPIPAPESPVLLRPKRNRKTPIYREPKLNRKLRRGDEFTFGIPRTDTKQIYKRP